MNSPLVCLVRLVTCLSVDQTRPNMVTGNDQFYAHKSRILHSHYTGSIPVVHITSYKS
ncbi:hypothetical protein Hanom_Chr12g01176161 [Helianthus anomalus]